MHFHITSKRMRTHIFMFHTIISLTIQNSNATFKATRKTFKHKQTNNGLKENFNRIKTNKMIRAYVCVCPLHHLRTVCFNQHLVYVWRQYRNNENTYSLIMLRSSNSTNSTAIHPFKCDSIHHLDMIIECIT